MEKIALEFKAPKEKVVSYKDVEIKVKPFISIGEQVAIIQSYLETYFNISGGKLLISHTRRNLIAAEYNLKHSVIHLLTNINTETIDTDIYDSTELWENIVACIKNYAEFREHLDGVVKDVKEEMALEKSVGYVLDEAVLQLMGVLKEYSKFNPEDLQKMSGLVKKMIDESSALPVTGKKVVRGKK